MILKNDTNLGLFHRQTFYYCFECITITITMNIIIIIIRIALTKFRPYHYTQPIAVVVSAASLQRILDITFPFNFETSLHLQCVTSTSTLYESINSVFIRSIYLIVQCIPDRIDWYNQYEASVGCVSCRKLLHLYSTDECRVSLILCRDLWPPPQISNLLR